MKKSTFLEELDQNVVERLSFPALDNANFNMAQTRLSVFRDEKDWLLAIEVVGFIGEFYNRLFVFGSEVREEGLIYAEEVLFFPEYPVDDEGEFLISPHNIHVYIKDEEIRIKPSEEAYKEAGLDLIPFGPNKLLRFLCHCYGRKFWFDDESILRISGLEKMQLFYRTEKWKHPDVSVSELPSQNEFFQQLDIAIKRNDPSIIEIKDPNTHWSNWTYFQFDD